MRIFKNLNEMYNELEREIKHNGLISQSTSVQDKDVRTDPDYKMKELIGYSYMVVDTSDRDAWLEGLGKNLTWAKADLEERLAGGINPGEAFKLRDVWSEFVHNGRFQYTYSERLQGQINDVVNLINNNKTTRQAVIPIYDKNLDNANRGGLARIPCSMYYHLIPRNGKLHIIYNMRSCDFAEHMPYDVWMACELRDHVAKQVGMEPGDFIHSISSLHTFYKDNKEIF